jgi:hypothetical protein
MLMFSFNQRELNGIGQLIAERAAPALAPASC